MARRLLVDKFYDGGGAYIQLSETSVENCVEDMLLNLGIEDLDYFYEWLNDVSSDFWKKHEDVQTAYFRICEASTYIVSADNWDNPVKHSMKYFTENVLEEYGSPETGFDFDFELYYTHFYDNEEEAQYHPVIRLSPINLEEE